MVCVAYSSLLCIFCNFRVLLPHSRVQLFDTFQGAALETFFSTPCSSAAIHGQTRLYFRPFGQLLNSLYDCQGGLPHDPLGAVLNG